MAEKTKKKSTSTKKEDTTKKTDTTKKKSKKEEDPIDDVLVTVGKEVAGKLGVDKKLVTKKNVKMVKNLVKENEAVEGALNTLEGLLGKK